MWRAALGAAEGHAADDGLSVASRRVEGSELPELEITVQTPSSPARLMAAAWELRKDGMQAAWLEQRTVLAETATERVLLISLRPPLVGLRECMVQQLRWEEPGTGRQHLRFDAVPFTPSTAGARPFAHLRGAWRFEPAGAGRTRVVYTTLVDTGGVPALLARRPQREAAVAIVREVVARAGAP